MCSHFVFDSIMCNTNLLPVLQPFPDSLLCTLYPKIWPNEVPIFITQTDRHTPYNPLGPRPLQPLLFSHKDITQMKNKWEGGRAGEILFKCSCKPSKILMLQSYLSIFKNIKGVWGRESKPGGTGTLMLCVSTCVCVSARTAAQQSALGWGLSDS